MLSCVPLEVVNVFSLPALTSGAIEKESLPGWVLNDDYGPIILMQTAGDLSHPTLSYRHILCLHFLSRP